MGGEEFDSDAYWEWVITAQHESEEEELDDDD
jgi:hypothetical protein